MMARSRFSHLWKGALKILTVLVLLVLIGIPIALWLAGLTASSTKISVSEGTTWSRIVLVLCGGLLLWCVVRAAGWKRTLIGSACILITVAATWIYNTAIWRDAEYRRELDGYKGAMAVTRERDPNDVAPPSLRWREDIALPNRVMATITASEAFDVARLKYSDERNPRAIFKYADYTSVLDVRRKGNDLYVLRDIILLLSERRLSHYDLSRRMLIVDRRIDPDDLR